MERRALRFFLVLVVGLAGLTLYSIFLEDHYLLFSFCLVGLALLPFFIRLEKRQLSTREIVLISILAAIAAISRIPFAPIPSVQPTSFVIIVSALVFGAETGFTIGALAALVSNLFLGQGPWTPWQMFSWGMIGFTAGLLKDTWWMNKGWGQCGFGFVWGFLFGWIMNLSYLFSFVADFSWGALITAYASSAIFDFMHALSNVFFLTILGSSWLKILRRFQRKYGLLQ